MANLLSSKPVVPPTQALTKVPVVWMLALCVALPLLAWFAPQYEAAGVRVAPLAPALALALGAAALFGWRALPAVAVGAAVASLGWPMATPNEQGVLGALTLVAQAAFGGMLLRRSGRADDLALDTRPALRRLLATALACGAMGGISQTLADMIWSVDPSLRPITLALVRAIADAASIVLLLPVMMAFVGPLRDRWLPRRRSVALPLLALAVLLWVALAGIDGRERQQAQLRFERDAEVVFARTQALLDAPVQALQALQGAFRTVPDALSPTQFDSIAQPWVKRSLGLVGIGWLEVPVSGLPGASTSTSAELPNAASTAPVTSASPGAEASRVLHVLGTVPLLPGAASAPLVSVFDLPALRQSVARATGQDSAAASPPVSLGIAPEVKPGFVLFQLLPARGGAPVQALGFAIVSAEALIAPIIAARSDGLRACLFDIDPRLDRRRLAGPGGCEIGTGSADTAFSREAAFDFGGRRWALRMSQAVRTSGGVWLFALPALAGSALLALLLAGMTGQFQRARHEARTRTDELKHEIDQHARSDADHENTVHALMDTVQVGVAVVDVNGRIQRVNAAFAELAGSNPQALQHRSLDDVLADAERPAPGRFAGFIQAAGDALMHQSIRLRNADGRVMPALVTLRVLRDAAGRANTAICAVHDLSENLRRRHVETVLGNVLDLPRSGVKVTPPALDAPPAGVTPPASPALDAAARDIRLLCIAGDGALADTVRQVLHERPDIVVVSATAGPQSLLAARAPSIQLVLLDLDVPDADGLALMRTLSAEGLPVIACSRDLRPQRIDQAFAAGARACLTLPPEPRQLLAAIDDLT